MMTSIQALDWAILSISISNTVLAMWLGLTVLLNTKDRDLGVWVMSIGLLGGGTFFFIHTAILGSLLNLTLAEVDSWWRLGWLSIILSPFGWYIACLWYGGFWRQPPGRISKRHRLWVLWLCIQTLAMVGLLLLAPSIPRYEQMLYLDTSDTIGLMGIPLLFIAFPFHMILSLILAGDVLLRPDPADYVLGDAARRKAKPWLLGTSGVLLIVSVLVTLFILWLFLGVRRGYNPQERIVLIGLFDLILAAVIGIAIVLLGQAIVSFEVFTGKTLPRRGFQRQWRSLVVVSIAFSSIIALTLVRSTRPVYAALLMTIFIGGSSVLYSWQSFVERERYTAMLRPFVRSQRLINHMLSTDNNHPSHAVDFFNDICSDVLNAVRVALVPKGVLAPLLDGPLIYPFGTPTNLDTSNLDNLFTEDQTDPVMLPHKGRYQWAVPLWADRGLTGVMLIGPKRDGGLYSQEEIEIAQLSGERIVDALAGEQMAGRLMQLQRQRLAASRVMDMHTRRILHDETLPAIHAAIIELSGNPDSIEQAVETLADVHGQISELIHNLPDLLDEGEADLETAIRNIIQTEYAGAFNGVTWRIGDNSYSIEPVVQNVLLGAIREVLRNAATHARGDKPDRDIHLLVGIDTGSSLEVTIQDDGVGLNHRPSVNKGGAGGGLALHTTLLALVGGTFNLQPAAGGGTCATIAVPL